MDIEPSIPGLVRVVGSARVGPPPTTFLALKLEACPPAFLAPRLAYNYELSAAGTSRN